MANENETVEQVCEKMKEPSIHKGRFPASFFDGEFCAFAERIIAAHKREIADFQRRYDECVRKFNEADLERVRLRDEVAAKDAEIAQLKACRDGECERIRLGAEPCAGCHVQVANDEIASLRAKRNELFDCNLKLRSLVKELADALWEENWPSYKKLIAKAAGEEVANG